MQLASTHPPHRARHARRGGARRGRAVAQLVDLQRQGRRAGRHGHALGAPVEHRPARLVQGAQVLARATRLTFGRVGSCKSTGRHRAQARPLDRRRRHRPSSASSSAAARRTAPARAATPSTASRSSRRRAEGRLRAQDADRADVDRRPGDDDAARHVPHRRRPRVARLPARRRVRDDPRLGVLTAAVLTKFSRAMRMPVRHPAGTRPTLRVAPRPPSGRHGTSPATTPGRRIAAHRHSSSPRGVIACHARRMPPPRSRSPSCTVLAIAPQAMAATITFAVDAVAAVRDPGQRQRDRQGHVHRLRHGRRPPDAGLRHDDGGRRARDRASSRSSRRKARSR